MNEEDKKRMEKVVKEAEPMGDILGKLPPEIAKDILLGQQIMLLVDKVKGISNALIDKGLLTDKDLDKGTKKATKQIEEATEFLEKLLKGA